MAERGGDDTEMELIDSASGRLWELKEFLDARTSATED